MKKWKIAGINFDHFHMGDLLRMAANHPEAEIVAICDEHPARMAEATRNFGLGAGQVFTDYRACLERAKPDLVILCPAAAKHGEWTAKVAAHGVAIMVEKPFAGSLAEADAMVAAQRATGKELMINWPLAWDPGIRTCKRLIEEGRIGDVLEVHSYGGNRGPLWHGADKLEKTAAQVQSEKPHSWFYKRSEGGGSLQDYAGYGTTIGTWFQGGRKPIEVTCVVDEPAGLEVDEHSVTIARYAHGLSKFETRWGTFTDPWTTQTQPKCGFVVNGTDGTLSAWNYDPFITLQTRARPECHRVEADAVQSPYQDPVQYFLHCLAKGEPVSGPVSTAISRIGQQIIDSAMLSAREKRTVRLLE
ncbi:MAG TPA: gfo/Idh/MocA family oxidoreductase [Verrucomicrobiales bacterium]|nr:gfo/Idh/MocA family oxidoreductase [Verrucomicrobiales bacterium]